MGGFTKPGTIHILRRVGLLKFQYSQSTNKKANFLASLEPQEMHINLSVIALNLCVRFLSILLLEEEKKMKEEGYNAERGENAVKAEKITATLLGIFIGYSVQAEEGASVRIPEELLKRNEKHVFGNVTQLDSFVLLTVIFMRVQRGLQDGGEFPARGGFAQFNFNLKRHSYICLLALKLIDFLISRVQSILGISK